MTSIVGFAKKLRHAADVLDDLVGRDVPTGREGPRTAKLIRATLIKKHRSYKPGTHWTQRPENRKKLLEMVKSNGKKRHAGANA